MPKKTYGQCFVCDDVAIGLNFGVPTCMPCKAFFRRNATKLGTHEFICQNDGDCIITYKYRRSCNCCRLAKCFRVGMKKSLILSDEKREARNKLIAINRLKRGQISKPECLTWMQSPSLLRMSSSSIQYLSSSDQVLLANIFHAYENTCIVAKNTTLHNFPTIQHTSIHTYMNEVSSEFHVTIEYLKLIPEFNNLIMDDKVRLIKNHIGTMLHVNEPLIIPVPPINLVVSWTNILGIEMSERLLKRNKIIEQYIFDPVILKVILIILVLSSGNCRNIDYIDMNQICDDSLSIFRAQNIYVELLWKYILSRSPGEKHAVKFLNKLMMFLLYAQNLHLHLDYYVHSLKDEIKRMEPIMQSMWPRIDNEEDMNIT
ncbi:unnamed protein product [Rotaria sordida]|uniref:Nuclear receptor domain-containing protein n=2 Tax=Rotaria sordida TaxID=392033 RepID=A0A815P1P5_9BILA|nr:unnamed protein product [Rotaria sordida]